MKLNLICFLLLTSFIGVSSEKRLVYRDSYVILFENVMADNLEKDVSLYINGAKQPSLIVIFRFGNGAITPEWRMNNYTKIFIDANRNIKIANIDKSYEGKYYIQSTGKREVELTISDNLTDEVEKIVKSLHDKQEVIVKSLGNVTDQIEKITKRLDDYYFGSWALTFAILVIVIVSLPVHIPVVWKMLVSLPVHIPVVWKMLKTGWFRCRRNVKTSKRHRIQQTKGTNPVSPGVDDTDSEAMNIYGSETVCVHFCRLRKHHDGPRLTLDGALVPVVGETKFLGRTDPDLPRRADPHLPNLPPPNLNILEGTNPVSARVDDTDSEAMNIYGRTDPDLPRRADPHLPNLPPPHLNIPDKEEDFLPTTKGKQKIDIRKT